MGENNDEKLLGQIKEGLDYLDGSLKIDVPAMNHFRQLVAQVEEKKSKGREIQFLVFILTAIPLLGLEMYSFYHSFSFFILIQMIAVVLPAAALFIGWRRLKAGE
jgi:hypothetical protein